MYLHPMRLRSLGTLAGVVALTSLSGLSHAGGFALIEHGASGLGNAYSGSAAVSADSSTVWFNPAGMSQLKSRQVIVGLHLLNTSFTFRDRGTTLGARLGHAEASGPDSNDASALSPLPNFYYSAPINSQWSYGLSIGAPFGSSTEYDSDWKGRYTTIKSSLSVIDVNPALSYKVNDKVSLGFGISLQRLSAELANAVDSGAACLSLANNELTSFSATDCVNVGLVPGAVANDGRADITGDSTSVSFNLGALFTPVEGLKIGVAYRHTNKHELDGKADFTVPESLSTVFASNDTAATQPLTSTFLTDSGVSAEVNLPATFNVSTAWQTTDKIELLGDITWTGWSEFEELRVVFDNPLQPDTVSVQNWENVFRYSVGVNYTHSNKLTFRAGLAYDEEPIPSPQRRTARIPGNDRTWLSLGVGYLINNRISMDFGYTRLFIDQTPIDNIDPESQGANQEVRGLYNTSVNIIGAQLNWNFN